VQESNVDIGQTDLENNKTNSSEEKK
jgi:hypothetical protein